MANRTTQNGSRGKFSAGRSGSKPKRFRWNKIAAEVYVAMTVQEILENAKKVLPSKADERGNVTPAAIGDALRAASDGDGIGLVWP
jgi:hypothetical protein